MPAASVQQAFYVNDLILIYYESASGDHIGTYGCGEDRL